MATPQGLRLSRRPITRHDAIQLLQGREDPEQGPTTWEIESLSPPSLGASYTHITSLKGLIGPATTKVVMYHAFLDSLEGFEDTKGVSIAYLGFNRIRAFRPSDRMLPPFGVLDLAGNPLTSLENCPPCKELIVSSCRLRNLVGCPEGVSIIRCGHSTNLVSLEGCPRSVELIECSCADNLDISLTRPQWVREVLSEHT